MNDTAEQDWACEDDPEICNTEKLGHRVSVLNEEITQVVKCHITGILRPSTAAFNFRDKDKGKLSLNRESLVIDSYRNQILKENRQVVAQFKAEIPRNLKIPIKHDPIESDHSHTILCGRKKNNSGRWGLTKGQLKQIANNCTLHDPLGFLEKLNLK